MAWFLPARRAPSVIAPLRRDDPDARFAACIPIILRHEGGYVDHPRDPGGATNHGISLRYARSRGSMFDLDGDGDVDKADIVLVTPELASRVYRGWFWRDVRGDDLPAGIDLATFDFAVNSGPGRATRFLQEAVGAEVDGLFGPRTLAAVRNADPALTAKIICGRRLAWLQTLPTWDDFGRGWTRRVVDVRDRAEKMAREAK